MKVKTVLWFILWSLLLSFKVTASELGGQGQAGRAVKWNGYSIGDGKWAPALWDISMRLPPAHKIIPGGPDNVANREITFTSDAGSIHTNIKVVGMQYRLTDVGVATALSSGVAARVSGNEVTVSGAGVGSQIIDFGGVTQTPFTHYRPILQFSENLINVFTDAKAATGLYQGRVYVKVPYEYYRNGIRIKNTLQLPVAIKLDYNGNQVTNVFVDGNNDLVTRFHGYPNSYLSGETIYTVRIEGQIPNGTWLGLRPRSGNQNFYLIKNSEVKSGARAAVEQIPFGVLCQGCALNEELINVKGQPMINTTNKRAKVTSDSFQLKVYFEDANLDVLTEGLYKGDFTLVFEAAL